jgi:hypothetical protein
MTTTGIARPSRFVDSTDDRDKQIDDGTVKLPGLWALGKHVVRNSVQCEIKIKTEIRIRKKIKSRITTRIRIS